jgi:chemotaxis protein methyltransferase CheR
LPDRRAPSRIDPDLAPEEFHLFRDYIHKHSGIFMEDAKLDSLRISLLARATFRGCASYQDYYGVLSTDEAEFSELMNVVTINETSFFRFPQQFDVLRRRVIPEMIADKNRPSGPLRVWSAGCSTGEEPYSVAITAAEMRGDGEMGDTNVQILGTDVSQRALTMGQRGEYGRRTMLNVPPEVIHRHFDQIGERYRVKDQIKRMVEFGYHNLIKEPYPLSMVGAWDVIFCRNVTIYFKLESTRRVVSNFFQSLTDGGYLFIGHSETLQLVSDEFKAVEMDGVFLYKKVVRVPKRTFDFLSAKPKIEAPADTERRLPVRPPPDTPEATKEVDEAATLVKDSRFRDALPLLESALKHDPNNAKAHLFEGYIHADAGEYDEAMAECQKAIAIDPLLAPARYVLGIIHQQRGEITEAISEFRRTAYIDADFALAHFQLGTILRSQGDREGARKAFRATLGAIRSTPRGEWTEFLGGFDAQLIAQTCERNLKDLASAR